MKMKIGLFGAAVNAVFVIAVLFLSGITPWASGIYLTAAAILAGSGFVVYYLVVSSYVVKRAGIVKPVFFDSLVGMLSELIVVTLGAACYSVLNTLSRVSVQNVRVFASHLAADILMNILWVFGMFTVHILIAGNVAGLLGWQLLKMREGKKDH